MTRHEDIKSGLRKLRYWYPPDAIDAAIEGRDKYWSLGGPERGIEWPMTEALREFILRAEILGREAREFVPHWRDNASSRPGSRL